MNSNTARNASMRAIGFTALTVLLSVSTPAPAQPEAGPPVAPAVEYRPTTVTSTGKATVYTVPTHVSFWIHRTQSTETLDATLKILAGQDSEIREAVTIKELRPISIETGTPTLMEDEAGNVTVVRVSTQLRFSMATYVTAETGQVKFGELCEAVKALSEGKGFLSGPHFETDQKNAVVQDAVREAAREAHPAGLGAAESMNTTIRAVEAMEVLSVRWNEPEDDEVVYPTIAQMACTAEVRVKYIVE